MSNPNPFNASGIFLCLMLSYILFSLPSRLFAQTQKCTDSICRNLHLCKTDSERIEALYKVSDRYYALQNHSKADSFAHVEMQYAEPCHIKGLILKVLLYNAYNCINANDFPSQHNMNLADEYLHQAKDIANIAHLDNYTVLVYTHYGKYYRVKGDNNEALKYENMALSLAQSIHNDSLTAVCWLELGATHEKIKKDQFVAFQDYTRAESIISKIKAPALESALVRNISSLYSALGDIEKAKEYLHKSIDVNYKYKRPASLLDDYQQLARLHSNYQDIMAILNSSKRLNDSLKIEKYILAGEKIELAAMLFDPNQVKKALSVLKDRKDTSLLESYKNIAPGYENYIVGEIYLYQNKPDSALHYFARLLPVLEDQYDITAQKDIYYEIANAYKLSNNIPQAILYFNKANALYKSTSNVEGQLGCLNQLEDIYEEKGDTKLALFYVKQYDALNQQVIKDSKDEQTSLKEIELERQQLESAKLDKEEKDKRRQNLAYYGITVVIAVAFCLLLTLGFFTVHEWFIKILGFFSFIFFFEFLTMLADKQIDYITHEDVWKVWLLKVLLISFLLPLHHWIEEIVIGYLASRKLIRLKKNFNLRHRIEQLMKLEGQSKG